MWSCWRHGGFPLNMQRDALWAGTGKCCLLAGAMVQVVHMSIESKDYSYDVFISYAHLDDQPLVPGEMGWVSKLHEVLSIRLSMLTGKKVNIWRDRRLRKNEFFDDTIADAVGATRLFLAVVTPLYIRSEYCQRELSEFVKINDIRTSNRSRIFKVLKTPVPISAHPLPMQDILGYEFYHYDDETGHAHEFRVDSGTDREAYLCRLDDLAQEIQECLSLMAPEHAGAQSRLAPVAEPEESMESDPHPERLLKESVYVCATSSDVRSSHDQVRRELLERGYTVLPDQPFILESNSFETNVREAMKQVALSVHIIGERYGIIPEDGDQSIVEIQNRVASEVSRETGLERIIWIPENVAPTDSRQMQFIESLIRDPAAQFNADVVVGTVEDLKGDIIEKIEEIAVRKKQHGRSAGKAHSIPPMTNQPPSWVYLIKGPYDGGEVDILEDCLWNAGMEVLTLAFNEEMNEQELNEAHQMNLRQADLCMVYYGESPERWVRKQLSDIRKSGGFQREKRILPSAVYIGRSADTQQKKFRSNSATVIWPNGAETAEAVKSFLTVLEESRCAS